MIVVYSAYDQSRHWVEQVPDDVRVVNWYDLDARQSLLNDTGPLHVGLFPTVFLWAEPWTQHGTHDDSTVEHEAGWVPVHAPDDWAAVEAAQSDYADRAERGWTATGDIPAEGPLTWTEAPTPPAGHIAVHDGWDAEGDGWVRRWRTEEEGHDDDNLDD